MKKKVIIIGGVAGGASAAARLRRLDEECEIIMLERGEYISFANCGLPYYTGGIIKDRDRLLVQTEEGMEERFHIDVRTKTEVIAINRQAKTLEIQNENSKYTESYDYLILSPGAYPIVPRLEGADRKGLFTLRNMKDVDRIKEALSGTTQGTAAVIGGGYVGIEMAENLKYIGMNVVLVEAADQILAPLDKEMSAMVERNIEDNGITVIKGDPLEGFKGNDGQKVVLKSGKSFSADIVILAIGVRPETELALKAGLDIGKRGGISVDSHMRTSDPYIFAVGDAVEVKNLITGDESLFALAGPANKQGRIAADNIAGRDAEYDGALGTSILKAFDLTAAATGSNEKLLIKNGIAYEKSYTHSGSHAGYYPGASMITLKLIFSKEDGRILGAQAVGRDGVDKRIDVLATAIKAGMTVYDLERLDLAYAPPYSSAKDPVNMAGYTAANILKGDVQVVHWNEIDALDKEEYSILDVRTPVEYQGGYIAGAVNIPVDVLRERLDEVPKDKNIAVYCKIGLRGYIACRILSQNGVKCFNLSGGYDIYKAANYMPSGDIKLDDQMQKFEKEEEKPSAEAVVVDATGLQCPGPIMKVYKEMAKLKEGDRLQVMASDPAFSKDIESWCRTTGNTLEGVEKNCCGVTAYLSKGTLPSKGAPASEKQAYSRPDGKTMVVFSGDLDKAIAAFIIANGAASMGKPVTMFFTFWGLNILRKQEAVRVKKSFVERMFGSMMPRGSRRLKLSNMNMAGAGSRMIRGIMKKKNISSLEELIKQAQDNGVKLMACSMSMDVMGIKPEELMDGVEIGGVATYLGETESANTNLFI
jgi:NADPH-dependent 2,4-dienoyl-CoA reductase/sulfur reductase-like enzyme/peroxiredoxin family protein/TusA-related sulfurtransferase/rhodanese-related sulfurtransferase